MSSPAPLVSHIFRLSSLLRQYVSSRPLIKDALSTTALSLLGKATGFLIPFFIAAWFGVSSETDAFFFSYSLIIYLATIFSPVVESIIVPFITEARAKGGDIGVFVGRILGVSAVGLLIIAILFLSIVKPSLSMLSRFSSHELDLIYRILLESSPLIILLFWTSVLAGTFNAYKVFSISALSPAFRAVLALTLIFFLKEKVGVHAIALGYVGGEIFRLFVMFVMLRKLTSVRIQFSITWDAKFLEFFKISSYQIIGMSMLAFIPIINKTMASWLGPGNVSLLEYADRLYMIPITLLTSGLMVTLLSHWSERYQSEGEEGLKQDVLKAVKIVGLMGVFLTIFLLVTKDYLVNLAYGYGQFPKDKIDEVGYILKFYLLGITPHFLFLIYARAFLIRKNTKILLLTAVVFSLGAIVFNFLFMQMIGVAGLALANSMMALLVFVMLRFLFHRGYAQWSF